MKNLHKYITVSLFVLLFFMAGSCNLEPLAIEDPGTMTEYRGNNGISYSIRLTGDDTGAVWGGLNGYYTDDSDVSTAAVHAGVINVNETDVIVVIIRPGRDEYFGSSANGITTGDWGSWSGSFEFE